MRPARRPADGRHRGAAILAELEAAHAFVVSVDAQRTWFRYHNLFADLLVLELRRTAADELPALHTAAAEWFAQNGHPVEAVRQAQAAQNWTLAARVLAEHAFSLNLDGHGPTVHELLAAFPSGVAAGDAELAVVAALDQLDSGSLDDAERYLALAERGAASVPEAAPRAPGALRRRSAALAGAPAQRSR